MKDMLLGALIVIVVATAFVAMNCSNFGPLKFCVFH